VTVFQFVRRVGAGIAALGLAAFSMLSPAARAADAVSGVWLYAMDCGRVVFKDMSLFSDTGDYDGKPGSLAAPCFLVRHPRGTLLWDTGLGDKLAACAMNFRPLASAAISGCAGNVPSIEPLSPMAPAIKSRESGEAISALTDTKPADSPPIVTRCGSPPNAVMFSCAQRNAATWSSKP
jgi:hypothetical protein